MKKALDREKVNSLALQLQGWIEAVRNNSAKMVGANAVGASFGCTISFKANSNNLAAGALLATVSPINNNNPLLSCAPPDNGSTIKDGLFYIPSDFVGKLSFSSQQAGVSNQATIVYTPRGNWRSATNGISGDLEVKLMLNGSGPLRCIRVSDVLGYVDIGSKSTSELSGACQNYGKF